MGSGPTRNLKVLIEKAYIRGGERMLNYLLGVASGLLLAIYMPGVFNYLLDKLEQMLGR